MKKAKIENSGIGAKFVSKIPVPNQIYFPSIPQNNRKSPRLFSNSDLRVLAWKSRACLSQL
jgi:hypothetical protein